VQTKHIRPTSSPSASGNDCNCFQLMLLRCKANTGRWSELSNSSASSRGTMQTFSFADSKLGYLTAAKGALVVRVRSFRAATPHHGGTVTSHKALNIAASAARGARGYDDDVKTRCLADETGNFTLVQRRSLSLSVIILFLNAIYKLGLVRTASPLPSYSRCLSVSVRQVRSPADT